MEFTAWIDILLEELPRLWDCVKTNTFPADFLTRALDFSTETLENLPKYLMWFMAVYLVCGLITIVLRFTRNQRSINSLAKQLVNVILTSCCILMIPLLPMLIKAIIYVVQNEVSPYQGLHDLVRYGGDLFGKPFYLIMAAGAIAATIWLPLGGALEYLRRHKLFGVPHAIFDYGTGMYLISTYLLSSYCGDPRWFLALIPAVIMLRVVQIGGYVPEEINSREAITGSGKKI